jgi:hypothetical protein
MRFSAFFQLKQNILLELTKIDIYIDLTLSNLRSKNYNLLYKIKQNYYGELCKQIFFGNIL